MLISPSSQKPVSEKIILYDIDEAFLKASMASGHRRRDVLGQLVADLYILNGAALVVLNILFAEADRLGGDDEAFISVLQSKYPVVGTQVASSRGIDTVATPRGLSFSGNPFRPYLLSAILVRFLTS